MNGPPLKDLLRRLLVVLVLSIALAALAACGGSSGGASPSASPASDPVVVTVNGQPVRRSAVDAVRAEFRLGGKAGTEAKALKEAIDRELVRREAARLGVVVDPAEVLRRRKAMTGQLGGEAALRTALQSVPMSDAQLQRNLEDGVLREALQDAKFPGLAVTRQTARAYYRRHRSDLFARPASVHLGAILVHAERIAETALTRLRSGRPFEEVARQFSIDPEAKAKGGDLGWVLMSSLPAPLRKAAVATRPGMVSKPFAGPGGWYVLKVMAVRSAGTAPFAAVERSLIAELTQRARFSALDGWLESARGKATVTRR